MDHAFRDAAWDLEHGFANGTARSNTGLYSWGTDQVEGDSERTIDKENRTPRDMARIVKRASRFYGADLVGICGVHPNWVYSHEYNLITGEHYPLELPRSCASAVVMAIAMDYEGMETSPTAIAGAATGLGYSKMAFVAHLVAGFLRRLGYKAIPCGNDTALSVPLAMAAGLGECGRLGLLVTKEYGPRVRICKVFTDAPLAYDSYAPFGVVEYCTTCTRCARRCPGQAISSGAMGTQGPNVSSHSGVRKWYMNAEKCYAFWEKNRMDCTTCIRVCPFNTKPGVVHRIAHAATRSTAKRRRTTAATFWER